MKCSECDLEKNCTPDCHPGSIGNCEVCGNPVLDPCDDDYIIGDNGQKIHFTCNKAKTIDITKFDNEMMWDDDDNEIWGSAELTHEGLSISVGKFEGSNRIGVTFSVEDLESMLAKLKGLQ